MESKSLKPRRRLSYAEYIWLDGASPTQEVRSKTRMLTYDPVREQSQGNEAQELFPEWSFDGSSTWQALGRSSDCVLQPVYFVPDPVRGGANFLVLCEVLSADGTAHPTNQRRPLVEAFNKAKQYDPWIGFEQEYTLLTGTGTLESERWPVGWPQGGYPTPQGPFYCGVGAGRVYGRDLVEEHARACELAGLNIYGTNAEVMLAQWEFQVGYRGEDFGGEPADPLTMSDHLWLARYLLNRMGEKHEISVSFHNKPISGDWNGAGMHTNFSTKETRTKQSGMEAIHRAVKNLEHKHLEHIRSYGAGLEKRLTGLHETCHINEFRSGISNRGASIRIPIITHQKGCGYIEDRRPGANADPYVVSRKLIETVCLAEEQDSAEASRIASAGAGTSSRNEEALSASAR